MRTILLIAAFFCASQTVQAAGSSQVLFASDVSSTQARAFSIESIRVAKVPTTAGTLTIENCDQGDNAHICTSSVSGRMKSVVQVRVGYQDSRGEDQTLLFNLAANTFSRAQIAAILNGASAESFVRITVRTATKDVKVAAYENCFASEMSGAGCESSGYKISRAEYVQVRLTARR